MGIKGQSYSGLLAPYVRRILRMHASGLNVNRIERLLKQEGVRTGSVRHVLVRAGRIHPKRRRKRPEFKQCRQCKEWYSPRPRAQPWQRFCSVSCAAKHRQAQPRRRAEQSRRAKALAAAVGTEVMRERARVAWRDPEYRARMIEGIRARANTQARRDQMIKVNKKIWSNPEFRKRQSERARELSRRQWSDPAYRAKMSALKSEQNKKLWADPELRQKMIFGIRVSKRGLKERLRMSRAAREVMNRPEQKERSRQHFKRLWADPEYRARITKACSERARQRWRNPAYRRQRLAALKAWVRSPEGRARMSESNKQRAASPEWQAKQRALWTPERRAKQAEINRKRWADPKFKARVAKKIAKVRRQPEVRKRVSEQSKQRWADPIFRARVAKAIVGGISRCQTRDGS